VIGPYAAATVLVAGVGNIFCGDDGFGVEVVRRLGDRSLPPGVQVADFGIRSRDLAYELLDRGDRTTILVDAMSRGGAPGTVYLVEPETESIELRSPADGHTVSPDAILGLVRALGGSPGRLLVVGCEPAQVDERIGLSDPVAAAVDDAIALILSVVRRTDSCASPSPAASSSSRTNTSRS
jgi:hydrogenase maturation protease